MDEIGDDEPVTLPEACRRFFGGRLTPSALRTEARKGNLVIMQIARKDFVTRRAIEDMKERCKVRREAPWPQRAPTERVISAQDALRARLARR